MALHENTQGEWTTTTAPAAAAFKIDSYLHEDGQHGSRSRSPNRSATPPISQSPGSRDVLNRIDGRPSPRAVDLLRVEAGGFRPRALSNPPPVKTPLHKILESEDEEEPRPALRVVNGEAPTEVDSRRRAGSFLSPLQRGYSLQIDERS
eukprot:m.30180 g.30180  ORF g.30180 m.30180 type:complete len:149 (-) comp9222_c1_seq1:248-694(-)